MKLSVEQIEKLAPKPSTFTAGKKYNSHGKWKSFGKSDRAIFGAIQGSGSKPYLVQVDTNEFACKCSCPSRQFPCKHSIGLLLLYSLEHELFEKVEEPEYVSTWIDKREAKRNKSEEVAKELTPEEIQKRAKSKEKRTKDREKFVDGGVDELLLWLKDLVRIGIIDFPSKHVSFFHQTAAKMVDAKVPGLAARVKAFNDVDFSDNEMWQNEVLGKISNLFLLLQSYKNKDKLQPVVLQKVKSLLGYTFKKADLLESKETLRIVDKWLILGSQERYVDDIKVLKTWGKGLDTGQDIIILEFISRFSNGEKIQLIEGSVIEAEMVFYPDTLPYRAFVHDYKGISTLDMFPDFLANWNAQHAMKASLLQKNPWLSDQIYLIDNLSLIKVKKEWILCDENKCFQTLSNDLNEDQIINLLMLSNNSPKTFALVETQNGFYPLGIFVDGKYKLI